MANPDCEICRGRGQIRLPRYRPVQVQPSDDAMIPATIDDDFKVYPCPECAPSVPIERVKIMTFHSQVAADAHRAADYMVAARRSAEAMVCRSIEGKGLVRVEEIPPSEYELTFPMRATLGVVSPTHVATIEQRIMVHQTALAEEVQAEAIASVQHWGSHYHHTSIDKPQVYRAITEALNRVLAKRAQWKAT